MLYLLVSLFWFLALIVGAFCFHLLYLLVSLFWFLALIVGAFCFVFLLFSLYCVGSCHTVKKPELANDGTKAFILQVNLYPKLVLVCIFSMLFSIHFLRC